MTLKSDSIAVNMLKPSDEDHVVRVAILTGANDTIAATAQSITHVRQFEAELLTGKFKFKSGFQGAPQTVTIDHLPADALVKDGEYKV